MGTGICSILSLDILHDCISFCPGPSREGTGRKFRENPRGHKRNCWNCNFPVIHISHYGSNTGHRASAENIQLGFSVLQVFLKIVWIVLGTSTLFNWDKKFIASMTLLFLAYNIIALVALPIKWSGHSPPPGWLSWNWPYSPTFLTSLASGS